MLRADIPTTTDREEQTDEKLMHKQADARARARHDAAQHKTAEENKIDRDETTLTFRALHGNHTVSIPFETIVKKAT